MKLKCIIVDDEELAILVIESYLNRIPNVEIIGKFNNALPVYDVLQNNEVDLLFLDIEMPEISGLDFVKSITKQPFIVFTTARTDCAIESYELNVIDYLIKPISFERLLKSVNRVSELKKQKQIINTPSDNKNFIYLKENKKTIRVFINDILYFESIKDYVKVITTNKTIITKQLLSYFETSIDNNIILRIHRSYIVMIDKIDAYSCSDIEIGKILLPIGRSYKDEVLGKLELRCSIK